LRVERPFDYGAGVTPASLPQGIVDLSDPDNFVDGVPHETFRRLRAEAPVFFHPERDGPGFWVVSKWDDVRSVSLDQATFSSSKGGIMLHEMPEDQIEAQRQMLTGMESGRHGKYRRLVSGTFAPKIIRALEPRLRAVVTRVLDDVEGRGACDFVTDVACELPVIAICELLGVPIEDRGKILAWSNAMVGMNDPEYADDPTAAPLAAMQLTMYASELGTARRQAPREDIVSELLRAEVDGESLTDAEFNAFVLILAVAGNETTRNLISAGLWLLCEHPDERTRVQADLGRLPTAIDEILRYHPPVLHFRRTAMRDVVLRGQRIREGDKVTVWYVSANRDEDVFPDADRFDVGRKPNDHLSFGFGPHFCLGAALAHLEARVMFEELFRRFPDVALAGPPVRLRANHIHGIKHLPVRLAPVERRSFA
jgi:cholest-4-en-3-one 26-monooxygenase